MPNEAQDEVPRGLKGAGLFAVVFILGFVAAGGVFVVWRYSVN